jgi:hypothetical protein
VKQKILISQEAEAAGNMKATARKYKTAFGEHNCLSLNKKQNKSPNAKGKHNCLSFDKMQNQAQM